MRSLVILIALAACSSEPRNRAVDFARWASPEAQPDCFTSDSIKGVDSAVCRFTVKDDKGKPGTIVLRCHAGKGVEPGCEPMTPPKAEQPQTPPAATGSAQ